MGIFNFDKEGLGISKDAPRKKGIFLFFELVGRKFGKFCQINMLYFLVSIPMIIVNALAGSFFVNYILNILNYSISDKTLFLMACQFVAAMFLIFIGSGPASASLSYFNRCAVREENTFLVSDFFENFKKNFKQGIIVGIINPFILYAVLFCIIFYFSQYIITSNIMWFIIMVILIIFCAVFTMANFYIYQLMITFENSILELYKNSFILALINIPQNLFLMLIILALNYVIFFTLTPIATLMLCCIFWIGIMRFIPDFYAARTIEKKLLNNTKQKKGN